MFSHLTQAKIQSPYLMTCKTSFDLQPHLPPHLWLYLTLFFSSVSHQAPGTEVCLLFLQFTLHIIVWGVWETVVSSAKNDLSSDISVNDSIDLYMFLLTYTALSKKAFLNILCKIVNYIFIPTNLFHRFFFLISLVIICHKWIYLLICLISIHLTRV